MTWRTVTVSSSSALWIFLELRNLPHLAAGGHDELELIGRMDRPSPDLFRAEQAQDKPTRLLHEVQEGLGDGEEDVHGCGDRKGNALGLLQGEGLRDKFPEKDVQVGDHGQGQDDTDGVGVDRGVRHATEEGFDDVGERGLADPA